MQWDRCQFRSAFQTDHCELGGTNECMQSEEEMGIMYHQSSVRTAVVCLDLFFLKALTEALVVFQVIARAELNLQKVLKQFKMAVSPVLRLLWWSGPW